MGKARVTRSFPRCLYARLSLEEVRRQPIGQKSYLCAHCPKHKTLRLRLNALNTQAEASESVLRLSMDAKARVKVGEFSRNGVSRVATQALSQGFKPDAQVTPVGILLPEHDTLHLFTVTGKVPSDCMKAFCGECQHFTQVDTLVLNLSNGPEFHSLRTQFMARTVQFVETAGSGGAPGVLFAALLQIQPH